MRIRGTTLLKLTVAAGMATTAAISAPAGAHHIDYHVAGGYVEPLGRSGDLFDPGWTASGGATFHVGPDAPVELRLDLGYSRLGATHQVIDSASYPRSLRVDDGSLAVGSLSVDAVYEFGGTGRIGGYAFAGLGGYNRDVRLEETVLIGGIYCDPIFPICVEAGAGDVIEHSDRLTKGGYDFGLAIFFPLAAGGAIYVETSYRSMDSDPDTEYLPIVVGYRW